ncbi:MAG: hypothetical protein AAF840_00300, partial [Bacteroidota bacterium]
MSKQKLTLSFRNLDLPKEQGDNVKEDVLYYPAKKGDKNVNKVELTVTNDTRFTGKIPKQAGFVFDFKHLPIVDLSGVKMATAQSEWVCEANEKEKILTMRYQGSGLEWTKGANLSWHLSLPVQAPASDKDVTGTIVQKDLDDFSALKDELPHKSVRRASKKVSLAYLRAPGTKAEHLELNCRFLPGKDGTLGGIVRVSEAGQDEIKNQVDFQLENRSGEAIKGGQLSVIITAGDAHYDLAAGDALTKFKLHEILREGESSELQPPSAAEYDKASGVVSWVFHPRKKDGPLLEVGGKNALNLALSEIVTYLPVGTAEITLLLTGMKNYEDYATFLKVDKILPTPKIIHFGSEHRNDIVPATGPLRLSWQSIALDDLRLSVMDNQGNVLQQLTHGEDGLPYSAIKKEIKVEKPLPDSSEIDILLTPKIDGKWEESEKQKIEVTVEALPPVIKSFTGDVDNDDEKVHLHYEIQHANQVAVWYIDKNGKEVQLEAKSVDPSPTFAQGFSTSINFDKLSFFPNDSPASLILAAKNAAGEKARKGLNFRMLPKVK